MSCQCYMWRYIKRGSNYAEEGQNVEQEGDLSNTYYKSTPQVANCRTALLHPPRRTLCPGTRTNRHTCVVKNVGSVLCHNRLFARHLRLWDAAQLLEYCRWSLTEVSWRDGDPKLVVACYLLQRVRRVRPGLERRTVILDRLVWKWVRHGALGVRDAPKAPCMLLRHFCVPTVWMLLLLLRHFCVPTVWIFLLLTYCLPTADLPLTTACHWSLLVTTGYLLLTTAYCVYALLTTVYYCVSLLTTVYLLLTTVYLLLTYCSLPLTTTYYCLLLLTTAYYCVL